MIVVNISYRYLYWGNHCVGPAEENNLEQVLTTDGPDNQLGGKSQGEAGVRDWVGSEGSQDTAGSLH